MTRTERFLIRFLYYVEDRLERHGAATSYRQFAPWGVS